MDPEKTESSEGKGAGYGSKWKKYLLLYIIAGGLIYLVIYLLYFKNGYGG